MRVIAGRCSLRGHRRRNLEGQAQRHERRHPDLHGLDDARESRDLPGACAAIGGLAPRNAERRLLPQSLKARLKSNETWIRVRSPKPTIVSTL
jgi:hypothetical protein